MLAVFHMSGSAGTEERCCGRGEMLLERCYMDTKSRDGGHVILVSAIHGTMTVLSDRLYSVN